jgi:predicted lipoprotein with Yx(FWY)xxD motif
MRNRLARLSALAVLALAASACNLPLTPVPGRGSTPGPVPPPATGPTAAVPNTGGSGSAQLLIRKTGRYGKILVDGSGRTLYMFTQDGTNTPTCLQACAKLWPPLLAPANSVMVQPGISSSLIGLVARPSGTRQVVYNGHPLYYFTRDSGPNEIKGEGFKGAWFLVSPAGDPIRK